MLSIESLLDHTVEQSIISEEYVKFRNRIESNKNQYYVYSLCYPNGDPFYVGKGKNLRAYDHINKTSLNNPESNKDKVIHNIIKSGSYPIIFLIKDNMEESEALELERYYIKYYARLSEDGILTNISSGGAFSVIELSSIGGKIGGKKVGCLPWWTNGIVNVRSVESPGSNYKNGMTRNNKKENNNE